MDENEKPTTTPPDATHEASSPPGNADRDEQAIEKSEEGLEQAGGGH
jgi:hypothetical protein